MELGPPELLILLALLVVPIVLAVVAFVALVRRPQAPTGGGPVGGTAPGWYPDPLVQGRQRYFDGRTWTDHLSG